MSDLSDLYQEILLEHNRKPRNFRKMEDATSHSDGYNPLCGDKLTLYLKLEGDTISDVSFVGSGCAISKASASMLTETLKGKSAQEAEKVFEAFHDMLTKPGEPLNEDTLGDLEMLAGVAEYPTRIKCAILSWHTLKAALSGETAATTE